MKKCLEPNRKSCDLCFNESKILNLKDSEKENYKPICNISFRIERCPSGNKCEIKSREYREGISFITKKRRDDE